MDKLNSTISLKFRKMVEAKRILIIDDDPGILHTLKDILEDEGYSIWTLETAYQAIHQIENIKPDLIFLDVHLPIIGGEDFIYILSCNGNPAKVVIMTGFNDVSEERAKFMGAVSFLKKPLKPDKIKKIANDYLKN